MTFAIMDKIIAVNGVVCVEESLEALAYEPNGGAILARARVKDRFT
jgi:hypothetical protein